MSQPNAPELPPPPATPAPPASKGRFHIHLADLLLWAAYLGAVMLFVPIQLLRTSGLGTSQYLNLLMLFLAPIPFIGFFGIRLSNIRQWMGFKRAVLWLVCMIPLAAWHYTVAEKLTRFAVRQTHFNDAKTAYVTCQYFKTAQDAYKKIDWDHDRILEYASSLEHLNKAGLIDPAFAAAEGPQGIPYHGYLFKVLTRQGTSAPGGAMDYVTGQHLTKGVAVLAVPAFEPDGPDMKTNWPFCWMFDATGAEVRHLIDFKDPKAFMNSVNAFECNGNGWELVQ